MEIGTNASAYIVDNVVVYRQKSVYDSCTYKSEDDTLKVMDIKYNSYNIIELTIRSIINIVFLIFSNLFIYKSPCDHILLRVSLSILISKN